MVYIKVIVHAEEIKGNLDEQEVQKGQPAL
jgi:hypothetical protein